MGLEKDMVCVMIHSGSRGLGYQVCDDALAALRGAPEKYGIDLPDRQLACAPVDSPEGREVHRRDAGGGQLRLVQPAAPDAAGPRGLRSASSAGRGRSCGMNLVYDVAHNIAKFEEHTVDGKTKKVWVHRKGATRAFPPGHPEVPDDVPRIGQPVIIPGDMGRASWVLVGQPGSMEQTFGTTCHGAGRAMSRTAAVQARAGPADRQGAGSPRRHRPRPEPEGPRGGAARRVQERRLTWSRSSTRPACRKKVARMRPIGVIKG